MAKASGAAATAQAIAKKLAKAAPKQGPKLAYEAFQLAALAGEVEAARALLGALYATPPAEVFTALSTHAMDGFAAAAGLGDVTGGRPAYDRALVQGGPLAERIAAIERGIRARLTTNAFAGDYPKDDAWRAKPPTDAWYAIDRWRRVQGLLRGAPTREVELDALGRLRELLADPTGRPNGPGGADALVVALDLALRHGATTDVDGWLAARGAWLTGPFVVETMLCLPAVARAMVAGAFRTGLGAPPADVAAALAEVVRAAGGTAEPAKPARPAKIPKVQKRTVEGEYSQVHLEPETRTAAEARHVYFQDRRESAQGMSIFPTMVGIATPSDTGTVAVVITIAPAAPPLAGAVQAVAFPLAVRGPLVVRGVSDLDDDLEPFVVPPATYDVQATFTPPARAGKPRSGLRRFTLALTFCPAGSLGAPRCYLLEDGSAPPSEIVAHR